MITVEDMYSETEVAEILYDLAGITPCVHNDIDKWLPSLCEIETCPCPEDKLGCWKQYLKHLKEREKDV